jgi:hypothetical protein
MIIMLANTAMGTCVVVRSTGVRLGQLTTYTTGDPSFSFDLLNGPRKIN